MRRGVRAHPLHGSDFDLIAGVLGGSSFVAVDKESWELITIDNTDFDWIALDGPGGERPLPRFVTINPLDLGDTLDLTPQDLAVMAPILGRGQLAPLLGGTEVDLAAGGELDFDLVALSGSRGDLVSIDGSDYDFVAACADGTSSLVVVGDGLGFFSARDDDGNEARLVHGNDFDLVTETIEGWTLVAARAAAP